MLGNCVHCVFIYMVCVISTLECFAYSSSCIPPHHHHIKPPARISMTLSRHRSLSSIAPGRSSRLYPVSAQIYCIEVQAGRPAFARPSDGVHRSMSLMSSFLLLQQCPACLVRLTWIVFVMGSRWSYSCCFVEC